MQQAVDAAQVDERAVIGQVLHHAGDHRALGQVLQRGALADLDLLFHRHLARDHHVSAAAVELDDLDRNVLSHQGVQVVHRARIGLRSRHEGLDAYVHRQPALDPPQHASGDDELLLVGLVQVVPDAQARGPRMREQHVALRLLAVVDHHIHHVAGLARVTSPAGD